MFTKLKNLFAARKRMKCAKSDAREIAKFTEPFIQLVTPLASSGLERNVPVWDLANHDLTKFLAYIGGVLDMADFLLKENSGRPHNDTLGIYISFYWYVDLAFDGLTNVDQFIKLSNNFIYQTLRNNSEIAGLPWMVDDDYEIYQKLGGDDFLRFLVGKAGYFPRGLFELGMFEDPKDPELEASHNDETTKLIQTSSEYNLEELPTSHVNRVFLIGKVVTEPEVRYLEWGEPVFSYRLETERIFDEISGKFDGNEYHQIKQFGVISENQPTPLMKGDQIYIQGVIRTRKLTDPGVIEKYVTYIYTNEVKRLIKYEKIELCRAFE